MSCPTCDHTMQSLDTESDYGIFWCHRCGTIKFGHGTSDGPCVPHLVGRCRDFENQVIGRITTRYDDVWRRTGVAESISLPGQRAAGA